MKWKRLLLCLRNSGLWVFPRLKSRECEQEKKERKPTEREMD